MHKHAQTTNIVCLGHCWVIKSLEHFVSKCRFPASLETWENIATLHPYYCRMTAGWGRTTNSCSQRMHTLSNLPQSSPLPIVLTWGLCLHRCSMSSLYCYLCLRQDILSLCLHNSISQICNLRPRAVQLHIQEHITSKSTLITDPQIFLGTIFKTPVRFSESQTSLYIPVAIRRMLVSSFRETQVNKMSHGFLSRSRNSSNANYLHNFSEHPVQS